MRKLRELLRRKNKLWMMGSQEEEGEQETVTGPGGVGSPMGLLLALTQAS